MMETGGAFSYLKGMRAVGHLSGRDDINEIVYQYRYTKMAVNKAGIGFHEMNVEDLSTYDVRVAPAPGDKPNRFINIGKRR